MPRSKQEIIPVEVLFVRHGYSCGNLQGEAVNLKMESGVLKDPSLTTTGAREAATGYQHSEHLQAFDMVFASHMLRAVQTALHLSGSTADVHVAPFINEKGSSSHNDVHGNLADMLPLKDVNRVKLPATCVTPPGRCLANTTLSVGSTQRLPCGHPQPDLARFLEYLGGKVGCMIKTPRRVLVVSHANTMRKFFPGRKDAGPLQNLATIQVYMGLNPKSKTLTMTKIPRQVFDGIKRSDREKIDVGMCSCSQTGKRVFKNKMVMVRKTEDEIQEARKQKRAVKARMTLSTLAGPPGLRKRKTGPRQGLSAFLPPQRMTK
jgi:broad specificity phosphatase PhoE